MDECVVLAVWQRRIVFDASSYGLFHEIFLSISARNSCIKPAEWGDVILHGGYATG